MTDSRGLPIKIEKQDAELPAEDTFVPLNWYFQQASWVADPRQSGSAAYNYALPLRVVGKLDPCALKQSLEEIVRRHEVLRSVFHVADGRIVQKILPPTPIGLPVTDLSDLDEAEREARARQLVLEDATQPFDLTRAPLLRAGLLRLGPEHHVLCLTTHHIVCDDWSTGILLRELSIFYGACALGDSAQLPELKFRYGDFVRSQRGRLQGKELDSRLSFWRRQLSGASDFYHVATDHPRTQKRTYRGSHEKLLFPPSLLEALNKLSRQERASLFMTLVAGFQCLLHHYSGHEDIGIGSCVANRGRMELEGLVGAFSNVVVLRTSLSGNPTFRELLRRVREVSLEALSYQDLPCGDLVETLRPQRHPDRNPLFQTLLVLQNAPKEDWEFRGATVRSLPLDTGTTRYELNVWLTLQEGLEVALQYNTDLFEAATIKRILGDYRTILEAMLENAEARIGDVHLSIEKVGLAAPDRSMLVQESPSRPRSDERARPDAPKSSELSETKRKLLEVYLRGKLPSTASDAPRSSAISRRLTPGPVPLSQAQLQVWVHTRLAPEIPLYNESFTFHRQGPIELAAVEHSLAEIIRRQEICRTTFDAFDGNPVQIVHPPPHSFKVTVADLRSLPAADRETEASRLAAAHLRLPFDLKRGPLLRATLVRMSNQDSRLYLAVHHFLIDENTAYQVLLPEFAALYDAFTAGKPSPLPELPIQYADYALWERQHSKPELLSTDLAYWRRRLAGDLPTLALPADHARPPVQSFRGDHHPFALSEQLSSAIRRLGNQEGVTPFVILAASFAALLHRYTDQDDLILGTVASTNRGLPETKALLGYFANPLPLRIDVSGNPSFQELIRRVQEEASGAFTHDKIPFESIVKELGLKKDPSRNPLFQVMISLAPAMSPVVSGWMLTQSEVSNGASKLDLFVELEDRLEGILGPITYNPDLFDPETIARMAGHWQALLAAAVSNPAQRVGDLPLLSEAERRLLLEDWNQTRVDYPKDVCLHELIEAQVERTPDNIALVYEDVQLTYRELNARANQLAHRLERLGVGPDMTVGICAERSPEMVVGLLGILKSGGAYLPLDPDYPRERLAFITEDANPRVLVTQSELRHHLPESGAPIICLDADWSEISGETDDNPDRRARAENLAYVIYTSGSTGAPKGAMNTHAGICNRLLWMQDAYRLDSSDCVLQKTPFTFDVSVWEFFWPLLAGARLVLARPGGHRDSAYLVDLIQNKKVTTLHFVPSMLGVFLEEQDVSLCESLRRVICSGEALSFELQESFFACLSAELHNLYGPTEASVDVSYWACERKSERRVVPIGRPIANIQIYLLDRYLNPVPVGVPGELHIGGIGLARGYLNRPELTAEKFITNPFSSDSGSRLYKTGDLARWLPDGGIDYLGRTDHQIKIRGYRIELGEIEAVLGQHPAVRDKVVILREDVPGDKRLVAYVVPQRGRGLVPTDLRDHLKRLLPEYMLPSSFAILDALPLTSGGKIDRRALPLPDHFPEERPAGYPTPRTDTEMHLSKIWAEFLGIEKVGIRDNFFELGGHSLLAVQMFLRISKTFGKELSLNVLFQAPTIEELARKIGEASTQPLAPHRIVAIQPVGTKPPLYWIPGGNGNSVLAFGEISNLLGPDQPVYGLEAKPPEPGEEFESIPERAVHFVREVREFQPGGPYYFIGFCGGGYIAFEMARQLADQGQQVGFLGIVECPLPHYPDSKLGRIQRVFERLRWRVKNFLRRGPRGIAVWAIEKAQSLRKILRLRFSRAVARLLSRPMPPLPPPPEDPFEAVRRVVNRYRPGTYEGEAYIFVAEHTWEFCGLSSAVDPRLAWRHLTTGRSEVKRVSGDHLEMVRQPNVVQFAEELKTCLRLSEEKGPGISDSMLSDVTRIPSEPELSSKNS